MNLFAKMREGLGEPPVQDQEFEIERLPRPSLVEESVPQSVSTLTNTPLNPAVDRLRQKLLTGVESPDIMVLQRNQNQFQTQTIQTTQQPIQYKDSQVKTFDEFYTNLKKSEGGYQDMKEDTGNIVKPDGSVVGTNLGITPAAWAKYKNIPVQSVTPAMMKAINDGEAKEFYRAEFLSKPRIDQIENQTLAENIFDMAVNAGPSQAIKIAQRIAGVEADGVIGPKTLAALRNVTPQQYSEARKRFYQQIVKKDPTQQKFLRGWLSRADKFAKLG